MSRFLLKWLILSPAVLSRSILFTVVPGRIPGTLRGSLRPALSAGPLSSRPCVTAVTAGSARGCHLGRVQDMSLLTGTRAASLTEHDATTLTLLACLAV